MELNPRETEEFLSACLVHPQHDSAQLDGKGLEEIQFIVGARS